MANIKDYMSNTVDHPALRARMEPQGALHELPKTIERLGGSWAGMATVEELTTIDQPNTYSRNYVNVDSDGAEKVFMYIGEILGFEQGTALAPFGNFSIPEKGNAKPMVDDTTVKQIIVLGPPTFGDEYVQGCFINQVVAVHEAITEEGEAEKKANVIPPDLRGIQVDSGSSDSAKAKPVKYERVSLKRSVPGSSEGSANSASSEKKKEGNEETPAKKVAVGDYMIPSLLPGYGGPLCAHSKAQCVVLDVRDAAGNLVLPPDYYKVIVPGALAWLTAVLKAWIYIDKDKNLRRKYYHLCITSIDIVNKSPFDPIKPEVRLLDRPMANLPTPKKQDGGLVAMRSLLRPVATPSNPSGSSSASSSTSPSASSSATASDDVDMEDTSAAKNPKPAKVPRRK
ncbi:hypothetical protein VNI00_006281 [Paramarasmius palmivorus]|uniref:Uncharacterized protein n=1 Tax=Paramarasmius palmivorus TaxID=297713 RepID=A0AAW0D873_9AGAR